jgi:prepilin-type N-terminal cleavage/methylation domain-containing protein
MIEYPDRIHSTPRGGRKGFTLIEIMMVTAIISILLGIAMPSWMSARTHARATACAKQLRTILVAKEQYAMRHQLPGNATGFTFTDLVNDGLLTQTPICPDGFSYTLGGVGQDPVCTSGYPGHVVAP